MKIITEDALVVCAHELGKVNLKKLQDYVTINGRKMLVDNDPEGCSISACPNIGVAIKPCQTTLKVDTGYSTFIRIDGHRLCLDTVVGKTDGTPPGVVIYHVRQPGQDFVEGIGMNNVSRYRSWRFLYPGLDVPEDQAGMRFAANGGIDMVQYNDSIRQAILLLFSTRPGERVMRPDYGCDIHRLVFSPNDDTTAGLAIYYVQRALDRWETRVEVLRLDAGRDPEAAERLNVTLQYRVRVTRHTELLSFSVNLVEG